VASALAGGLAVAEAPGVLVLGAVSSAGSISVCMVGGGLGRNASQSPPPTSAVPSAPARTANAMRAARVLSLGIGSVTALPFAVG
jgi:hypothetical protein